MSYENLKQSTQDKLSQGKVWAKQTNDPNIIDVSLNAGPLLLPSRAGNGLSLDLFTAAVELFIAQFSRRFPILAYEERSKLHSTLITVFNDKPEKFDIAKNDVYSWCGRIAQLLHSVSPIRIGFDEVVLTSNGSLILTGQSYQLEKFMEAVYGSLPIPARLHKNIIHMTLGRLIEDRPNNEISNLVRYLADNGKVKLPELAITSPNFVVSIGSFSSEMDAELTSYFNQVWA